MNDTVDKLRRRVASTGFTADADVFDLLLAACLACCTQVDGGNKTCPPKAELSDS